MSRVQMSLGFGGAISSEASEGVKPTQHPLEGHIESFAKLWDEINAKRGFAWYANPWVWVVEFRRIKNEHS